MQGKSPKVYANVTKLMTKGMDPSRGDFYGHLLQVLSSRGLPTSHSAMARLFRYKAMAANYISVSGERKPSYNSSKRLSFLAYIRPEYILGFCTSNCIEKCSITTVSIRHRYTECIQGT